MREQKHNFVRETDLILRNKPLLKDGKDMHVVTELATRFSPHGLVEDVVRAVDMGVHSEQDVVQDPHILLATTGQLPSTARLAMELHNAGATVSLIAPSHHPARALDLISHRAVYRALGTTAQPGSCGASTSAGCHYTMR